MFTAFVKAYDISGSVTTGVKRNSNIELHLHDRINNPNKHYSGYFMNTDASLALITESFSFDYILFSDYGLSHPEYSKQNHYGEISFESCSDGRICYTTSVLSHYALEDYSSLKSLYFDTHLYFSILIEHTETFSSFFNLKAGYYKGIYKNSKYLTGPAFTIEIGSDYSGTRSDLRVSIENQLFYFTDEKIIHYQIGTFNINNQYLKSSFKFDYAMKLNPLILKMQTQYSYMHWFGTDAWQGNTKKRKDHIIDLHPSISIDVRKLFEVEVYYDFKKNISSLKRDDYTDYNQVQHLFGAQVKYDF